MSMAYELAFREGERRAFYDRKNQFHREPPKVFRNEGERGWWDGYLARNGDWCARSPNPSVYPWNKQWEVA